MIAVYPGSFDPITLGNEDIIMRASMLFDHLVVAVARDNSKNTLLSFEQRFELVKYIIGDNKKVSVESYEGLTINFVSGLQSRIIISGIRSQQDYDYEAEMSNINFMMSNNIETLLLSSSDKFRSISSSRVREIFTLGGNITNFVSDKTYSYLKTLRK